MGCCRADEAEAARIFPTPPPPAEGPDWLKYLTDWDGKTPMVTAERVRSHLCGVLTHRPEKNEITLMMAALRVAPNGVAVAAGFRVQTVHNPLTGGKQGCFFESKDSESPAT
jgi:hypothetical protein